MTPLYTAGYEGHSPESFIALLQAHGVTCLVDVRESPNSRKPGFSKKKLAAALDAAGIAYAHLPELGTPKPLRDKVKKGNDYEGFFEGYERCLDGQPEALEHLRKLIRKETACLMCYEKEPEHCHRSRLTTRLIPKRSRIKVQNL